MIAYFPVINLSRPPGSSIAPHITLLVLIAMQIRETMMINLQWLLRLDLQTLGSTVEQQAICIKLYCIAIDTIFPTGQGQGQGVGNIVSSYVGDRGIFPLHPQNLAGRISARALPLSVVREPCQLRAQTIQKSVTEVTATFPYRPYLY